MHACKFLSIQNATIPTNSNDPTPRLKISGGTHYLMSKDGIDQIAPPQEDLIYLNFAADSFLRVPYDFDSYELTPAYRILPNANRYGGTCALGTVVDPNSLRLKSFKNLRICDGSIIPYPGASDGQVGVMAFAEWLSEQILN